MSTERRPPSSPPPGSEPPSTGAGGPPRPRRFSRRRFLTGLGAAGAAAVAGGYGVSVWARGGSGPGASTPPSTLDLSSVPTDRTLVVLELAGGNDGLNMVVPYASGTYHDLRPTLAVDEPLELDDEIGLHPALVAVGERYEAGDVAIVEGIGYPDPDLSHFASLATLWSASVDGAESGWLGRYLDATVGYDDPLAGLTIGSGPSLALVGEASFSTSIRDSSGLQPALPRWADSVDDVVAAWSRFAPSRVDATSMIETARQAIGSATVAQARLERELGVTDSPGNQLRGRAGAGARGRDVAGIAESMELAATLAASDDGPRIILVQAAGDFDTHQGQETRQPVLMEDIGEGITRYLAVIDERDAGDRTLLMTSSEFGRRPAENGSGTDHGTAAAHLLIGAPVSGGRYGEPPDLDGLDDTGNLAFTVDFRSVFATVMDRWLGVEPEAIFDGDFEQLDFI